MSGFRIAIRLFRWLVLSNNRPIKRDGDMRVSLVDHLNLDAVITFQDFPVEAKDSKAFVGCIDFEPYKRASCFYFFGFNYWVSPSIRKVRGVRKSELRIGLRPAR